MKSGAFWDDGSFNSRSYESHHINAHINTWFCSGCTLADKEEHELEPPPLLDLTGVAAEGGR